MRKRKSRKVDLRNHEDASPVKSLASELLALRHDLRTTVRAYAQRLERDLIASATALQSYGPADKLSQERLRRVRDLTIMVRTRRLKPKNGRRKDLRQIDTLIADLQPLVDERS